MRVIPRRLFQYAILAVALNATAASTYLPLVGPPALRFEPPRVEPVTTLPALPPLPPFEPKAAAEAPTTAVETPATTTAAGTPISPNQEATPSKPGAPVTSEEPAPPPQETASNPAKPEPPIGPIENLTPQMFMKFFSGRPGSNAIGSSTTIYAPLPFIPPVPPAPPSSSATYQTTPPAKP